MIDQYLQRIGLTALPEPTIQGLMKLHKAHLFHIPFEDLDIHRKVPLSLDLKALENKIIHNNRGGFCYELNSFFANLLRHSGFDVDMISASVFDDNKKLGPEFDHLALVVRIDGTRWLADVGFGDLFIRPLNIDETEIQINEFHSFRIKSQGDNRFLLSMSMGTREFESKYIFDTTPRNIEDFEEQCLWKQSSPDSHFVKNKICTLATPEGRKTILNDKFMQKSVGIRADELIKGEVDEDQILREHFNISLEPS